MDPSIAKYLIDREVGTLISGYSDFTMCVGQYQHCIDIMIPNLAYNKNKFEITNSVTSSSQSTVSACTTKTLSYSVKEVYLLVNGMFTIM